MAHQTVVGIDIGTSEVRVVVAEGTMEHGHVVPRIIGTGSSESRGIYRGYISNKTEATRSISLAVRRAEKACGTKLKRAYVSFGGIGLGSTLSSGSISISRPDLEIIERDLTAVLEAAEALIPPAALLNKRIINTIPIEYKLDGKTIWGEPAGLKAQKLEVRALFITCLEHHLADIIGAVEDAGVEVVDVVASPIASSFVTLSKKQKRVGCLLADFGAETLSIVVFENNNLISLAVFPVGSNDITNDIALGLKISLENAENVKLYPERRVAHPKKKLEEIISARLNDCFELIQTHLKQIGRDALLPAGVVMSGGGANMTGVKESVEQVLKLPFQMAEIHLGTPTADKTKNLNWAVACGLAIVGINSDDEQRSLGSRNGSVFAEGSRRWGKQISRWVSQFLP